MAGTTSISGLASGLDTATIISQLMQIEAQPQNGLKTKLSGQQTGLRYFQDLNTKLASLATTASDLSNPGGLVTLKATSSSTSLTATATTGTASGSFDVTVNEAATTHRLTYTGTAQGGDHVTGATNNVALSVNGVTTTISSDGTLDGMVGALNATGTGVRASTIRLDDGSQRLIVQSVSSGAAGQFTLTGSDGADLLGGATVLSGRDASITIGSDTLHSASNTFGSVFNGVSLTIDKAAVGTTATIDVKQDSTQVKAKIQSLVDSVNGALSAIDAQSGFDPTNRTAGVFAADPVIGTLRTALLSSVYPADNTSLASLGLQTDRSGKFVFDGAAFDKAYAADPAKTTQAFTNATTGFAKRVQVVAKGASDSTTGTLTSLISGKNTSIKQIQTSISDWDARLALRQASLQRQFTALETAMSTMKSQSSWLSGQLSSLSS